MTDDQVNHSAALLLLGLHNPEADAQCRRQYEAIQRETQWREWKRRATFMQKLWYVLTGERL